VLLRCAERSGRGVAQAQGCGGLASGTNVAEGCDQITPAQSAGTHPGGEGLIDGEDLAE
jgi:hypothetical protein